MKKLEEEETLLGSKEKEVLDILNELGLEDEEIISITKRNRLLNETTANEVENIVNFFEIKCNLDKDDIASLVLKNPLVLNESFTRLEALAEIYDKIGFSKDEYKKYINNFDKAFSLNPKEILDNVFAYVQSGKEMSEVKSIMIENASQIFW